MSCESQTNGRAAMAATETLPAVLAVERRDALSTTWRERYYPGVANEDWEDWRWQFRNRLTTLADLERFFPFLAAQHAAFEQVLTNFRLGVTPYSLSLIDPDDPADPLRLMAIPSSEELISGDEGDADPLAEEAFSPVPGIVHRYPDRCLLIATNSCALYCRYCTRKRIMEDGEAPPSRISIDVMVDYIARTQEIRDVIVSGGDPLTWSARRLEDLLGRLRAIRHVEIIRLGSRVPVTLPQRIDAELCATLERFGPIWMNVHFNHPREVTAEAALACDNLLRSGVPLNNQSVLLKGVNDDVATMKALVHALMRIKVRPYYLYACDPVRGSNHFRVPIAKGIEIIEALRGHTSGLAVPTFVIDAPGGGGKIPIHPTSLLSYQDGVARVRNYRGRIFEVADPETTSGGKKMKSDASISAYEEWRDGG